MVDMAPTPHPADLRRQSHSLTRRVTVGVALTAAAATAGTAGLLYQRALAAETTTESTTTADSSTTTDGSTSSADDDWGTSAPDSSDSGDAHSSTSGS